MGARHIGSVAVTPIGFGTADLIMYPERFDEVGVVRAVHAALSAGMTLIDTADAYTPWPAPMGLAERVIATALRRYGRDTSHVLVATKVGHTRAAGGEWGLNGAPGYLRRACDASLRALGVEAIGLYLYHRPDPTVPFEVSLAALRGLRESGKVRWVGISNVDRDQIRAAHEMLGDGLAAVQNEFSPWRPSQVELRYCAELGTAFMPWAPFGGAGRSRRLAASHPALAAVGAAHGVSPHRACLAWMLALGSHVIPVVGTADPNKIRDCAAASGLELSADELAGLAGPDEEVPR
jgi:aryl-alcohol dehydrogenase-like predicted oxidoreductase